MLFLGLGKLLLWLLEVLPPHIWGRHLPRIFYDSLAGFGMLIGGGIALLVVSLILGDRLYFRRIKNWLER